MRLEDWLAEEMEEEAQEQARWQARRNRAMDIVVLAFHAVAWMGVGACIGLMCISACTSERRQAKARAEGAAAAEARIEAMGEAAWLEAQIAAVKEVR